jgi:subtilisin family serine protease
MRLPILTFCLAVSQITYAQVGLPSVRLPTTGSLANPLPTELPLRSTLDAEFKGTDLTDLRALRVRTLLRVHRDVIEADSRGNPTVRGEVLAVSPSTDALQAAARAGFSVVRESSLEEFGTRIVVLHVASGTERALKRLRTLDPSGIYDFNHVYIESGMAREQGASSDPAAGPNEAVNSAAQTAPGRVGLIDTGVDASHEVFRGLTLHPHGCAGRQVADEHGTAVASLMVGRAATFHGAAAGSDLYAVDVYCGLPTGGAVDAVAEGFAWLAREALPVINVSLVGPPNRVLEVIVRQLIARGHIIVAAVGNDGAASPPLFPAAWPGVVGVTAVDERRRVLVEAERGAQVTFAAPGAQMAAAKRPSGYALVRGTSFAAPIVAGLLSLRLHAVDKEAADKAIAILAHEAVDLGSPGLDPVYGYGLVGEALRSQPALAALRVQ